MKSKELCLLIEYIIILEKQQTMPIMFSDEMFDLNEMYNSQKRHCMNS